MRPIASRSLAATALLLCTSAPVFGQEKGEGENTDAVVNRILNPGFTVQDSWDGTNEFVRYTDQEYFTTPDALLIEGDAASERSAMQTVDINQLQAVPLVLAAGVMGDENAVGGTQGQGIAVGVTFSDGTTDNKYYPWPIAGAWEWAEHTQTLSYPKPVAKAVISLTVKSHPGQVYFDDISLTDGAAPSPIVQPTGLAQTSSSTQAAAATTYPAAPLSPSTSAQTRQTTAAAETQTMGTVAPPVQFVTQSVFSATTTTAQAPTPTPSPIPTDCTCTEWSSYQPCTTTCGGGVSVRTRQCTEGTNGGKACSDIGASAGALNESMPCNTQKCLGSELVKDGGFEGKQSAWSSLGNGFRLAQENAVPEKGGALSMQPQPSVGGSQTAGAYQLVPLQQEQPRQLLLSGLGMADEKAVPELKNTPTAFGLQIDVLYVDNTTVQASAVFPITEPWAWTALNTTFTPTARIAAVRVSCVASNMTGAVFCDGITMMEGDVSDVNIPCQCEEWGEWGVCSTTCGSGSRTRQRSCTGGDAVCEFLGIRTVDTGSCTAPGDCPSDCTCGDWSSYGACSANCGEGSATRTRTCTEGTKGGLSCAAKNLSNVEAHKCVGLAGNCSSTSALGSANLVQAGSFEPNEPTTNGPAPWQPIGEGYAVSRDVAYEGSASAMLKPNDNGVSGMQQTLSVPTVDGRPVVVRAMAFVSAEMLEALKSSKDSAVQLQLDAIQAGGKRRRATGQSVTTLTAGDITPNTWVPLQARYTLPPSTAAITVSVLSRRMPVSVAVDSVQMYAAQSSVLADDCVCTDWTQVTTCCGSTKAQSSNWTRVCIAPTAQGQSCSALGYGESEQRPCSGTCDSISVTSSPVETSSGGLSGGAIAGIVFGILAVVALCGAAFFYVRRNRGGPVKVLRPRSPGSDDTVEVAVTADPSFAVGGSKGAKMGKKQSKTSDELNGALSDRVNQWRERLYQERMAKTADGSLAQSTTVSAL